MKSTALKVLALGGLVGPVLFTCVILVCAYARQDYGHLHNLISELGATATPNEKVMNLFGFITSGLILALFGFTLLKVASKSVIGNIGASAIIIFGLGMTFAGIYSCDQGCPPNGSFESIIHNRVSAITFISAIVGIILMGISFRKSKSFHTIASFSIVLGILSAALLVIMINSFEAREFTGLWQRLLLFMIFLWTSIVGLKLFKAAKS